ncbi:protein adenylyltransferase SelO [Alkalibacillus silvisoli]|uniref:Protein nucleotidyltransferase YdiU n=1 Tax=Alkalibacillus silvisoli TaxID=392823 RepID=A0ABN0ZUU6_9BACI
MTGMGWNLEHTYTQLPELFYSHVKPTPVEALQIVFLNGSLANSLGLDRQALQSEEGLNIFSGNKLPENSTPIAQAYAGHQFGHFTMLGDGRAHLLGEQVAPDGKRYDVQLKGSGQTPYSRRGDGRAVLGPMLREYVISEAMYALGVPSNRSLAVVVTGEAVKRETVKPGAILTRVADSHLRVGTFQYARQFGTTDDLRELADYALERHYSGYEEVENRYIFLLEEVMKRQAKAVSQWQLVGFIHGVMNTDNMTISGETIDYGPCAFMNAYDPETVFSSIDEQGRYKYGNQPRIAMWNLARLAESLLPLIDEDEDEAVKKAEEIVHQFIDYYRDDWLEGMRAKLGIFNSEDGDETLIDELLSLMKEHEADFTNTFRGLTLEEFDELKLFQTEGFTQWYQKWQERLNRQEETKEKSLELMKKHNPSVIPRNHRVEEALEAAEKDGDLTVVENLLRVLSKPYAYTKDQLEYTKPDDSDDDYMTFCGT